MYLAAEGTDVVSGVEIIGNVLPAMVLVIGTPLAIWWWLRRTRGASTNRLRVTDKAALGRNTWIAVAEIDGQRFLLGAGEHGVGLLSQLEPAPVAEPEAAQDGAAEPATDRIAVPRMGLIERLQQMTLRTPTRPPGSFDALRR